MKIKTQFMTHNEIYQIALNFLNNFETNEVRLPAAIAFAIQKNKNNFIAIGQEIEQSRIEIIQHYGTLQENGQYIVKAEYIDQANKELFDLLKIEQEMKIYVIDINDLENITFTSTQMETLMFMIEDGEETLI